MSEQTSHTRTSFSPIFGSSGNESEEKSENHLQGLYLDLLGCLGGSPNQTGIQNPKPMTGFSQILNMITDAMSERQGRVSTPITQQPQQPRRSSPFEPRTREESFVFHHPPPFIQSQNAMRNSSQHSQENYATATTSFYKSPSVNPIIPISLMKSAEKSISSVIQDNNNNYCMESSDDWTSCGNTAKSLGSADWSSCGTPKSMKSDPSDAFTQEIADALKHYDLEGLPKTVGEVEEILQNSSLVSPTLSEERIGRKVRFANNPMDESPLSIGGGMITKLLDNFLGVAYHCCPELQTSTSACRYCTAVIDEESSCDPKSSEESDVFTSGDDVLDDESSTFHECNTGEESGDDGWSSAAGSDDEGGKRA